MAAVATVFGGVLGYLMAAVAWLVFGASLWVALAVWALGGITILGLALFMSRREKRQTGVVDALSA